MTPSLSREKKEFFDLVKNYSYFTPNGWFDLEAFCVSVSLSLVCDDQPDLAPQPIDIYRAFLRVAKSRLDKENFATKNVADI